MEKNIISTSTLIKNHRHEWQFFEDDLCLRFLHCLGDFCLQWCIPWRDLLVSEANTGTYAEMHSLKTLQSVINLLQLEISFSVELEIGIPSIRKLAVFSNMNISQNYWNAANLHIGCIL